jgi:hypothetical protein
MGLLSRLRSRSSSDASSAPEGQQPGAASQPEGDGPVTLEDRTEPGGQGSPDTNQAKTEPMAPETGHPEAPGAPSLASMNVGAGDAQAPSHVGAQPPSAGSDSSTSTATEPGADSAGGYAQRAWGRQGATPEGEAVGTDVEAGASALRQGAGAAGPGGPHGEEPSGAGDTGPSPAVGDGPLQGSSEELPVVQGVRRPQADEA